MPVSNVSKEQPFKRRRDALLKALKEKRGMAVLFGAKETTRNSDVVHPFRQESSFFYLTGIEVPNAVAIFAPEHRENYVVFLPEKNPDLELWVGKRTGTKEAVRDHGATAAYPIEKFDELFPSYLSSAESLFYTMGSSPGFDRKLPSFTKRSSAPGAPRKGLGMRPVFDAAEILGGFRQIKSKDDVEAMKKAASISAEAHKKLMRVCRPGLFEYQLHAELMYEFMKQGSPREAYESIVASGRNATTLHYVSNRDELKDGDLILVDAGCEYDYFASDITRTFPVNGEFSDKQKKLYEVVLEANKKCIEQARPGQSFQSLQDKAIEVLWQGWKDLQLITESLDWARENYRDFFPHNVGHFLGMDVHDVGAYSENDGSSKILKAGMTLTIEPGVYVREDGLAKKDAWAPYNGIGIRIEDDVLITEKGAEILTSEVPKEMAEIEKLMSEKPA